MTNIPLNITINPAANGYVIFVTPKFIMNAGDRCFVAKTGYVGEIVSCLAQNIDPDTGEELEWPYDASDSVGE